MNKTATLLGASGLIGNHLLLLLLEDSDYKTVKTILRSPISIKHTKLQQIIIDLADEEAMKAAIENSDAVFCTIGTTNKKVKGNKQAYNKVDFDIPVLAAKLAHICAVPKFVLVSVTGANANSNNFYIRLKGMVEDVISNIPIPSIGIMQPSILLGKRKERRVGEQIGKFLMQIVSPLFVKKLQKYKPIHALDVAEAMISFAKDNSKTGVHTFSYEGMMRLKENYHSPT